MMQKVNIADILPRPAEDTRAPDPEHVLSLAESIAQLGLLEPIVVDRKNRLVAGRTRLEALRLLSADGIEQRIKIWRQICPDLPEDLARLGNLRLPDQMLDHLVPVHMLDIDASDDSSDALAYEIAENELRRDYTREEIVILAERLVEAGYIDRAGKPRKGEKALKPALAAITRRSPRTIARILSGAGVGGRKPLSKSGGRKNLVLSVDPELDQELRKQAKREKKTLAELSREILKAGLEARSS